MKRPLSLSLILAMSLGSQALSQDDLYRAFDCGNIYKNPDADASPAMKKKVYATFSTRTTAAGMMVNIGINNAQIDMRRHRAHQCKQRAAGKEFEAQCPFGKIIFVDDYVDAALNQYGDQDNGSLQSIMEQGLKDGRVETEAMKALCE